MLFIKHILFRYRYRYRYVTVTVTIILKNLIKIWKLKKFIGKALSHRRVAKYKKKHND